VRTQAPVPVRRPFAGAALLDFLLRHTVAGVETGSVDGSGAAATVRYARTLRLPHGPGVLVLRWADEELSAEVDADPRDAALVLGRVAHLVDADADPAAVDGHLGRDPHLSDLVAATPGLRVPGVLDVAEMVFRTLIGQQISLASARACGATISRRHGEPVETGDPDLQFLFPDPAVLAALDPTTLPMPRARGRSLVAVAQRMVDGRLDLSDDLDPALFRDQLLDCPGIGPWTADYVAMRARHQPDVLLGTDLIIKRELVARGITDPDAWRPYRSYATLHLWHDFLARTAR
jgi:AraC family transcriptional regulator of adaptative response / DNA-3-methyladenine glycosylase II